MTEFWRSTALTHLEARRSCQENTCYRVHTHDALSIGVIDAGDSLLAGPLDGTIPLEAGDIVVIPAGQAHACNPDRSRWLHRMVHLDQSWGASLLPDPDHSPLFDGISVFRRPGLHALLTALTDAVFADPSEDRLAQLFRDALTGLEQAAPVYRVTAEVDPELLEELRPVLSRLLMEEVNPSLDELASSLDMTKFQLIRAVRRTTGLPPLAWRQNARIVRARHLLREGRSIADTANDMGFVDQSHFHRVFRAHVATSPGEYRR
ncbi:helix-turn-helix domain-containing protein [Tessaracoccus palaemonis]|uniref:AraC family transcriptional regulator n=1 Tax=Tessaracoccus palaemonis TaxID=2829499 RepID=A0ABX8SIV1_9ACTN|nr:helix-turn-helix domain-containing protein [Tessaracoccus palaemonis]QXT63306.1 AraC family transcriptional regulator [Tessaracoccus palaemonis]